MLDFPSSATRPPPGSWGCQDVRCTARGSVHAPACRRCFPPSRSCRAVPQAQLKADPSRPIATSHVAEYLGQLKVLQRYIDAGKTSNGVYSLMALWRSVESLAEESHVAPVYTRNLNGVMEDAPWRRAGRILQLMVSRRGQLSGAKHLKRFCVGRETMLCCWCRNSRMQRLLFVCLIHSPAVPGASWTGPILVVTQFFSRLDMRWRMT